MKLLKDKKFKTCYYRADDIKEWVYENPTYVGNPTTNTALISVQETKLYNKKFSEVIGNVLQDVVSYKNRSKELTTYKSTYFFEEGSISFNLNFDG